MFKSRADKISHILPTTRHRDKIGSVGQAQSPELGTAHLRYPKDNYASIMKIWWHILKPLKQT